MAENGRLRVATFNIQHAATGDYKRGYPELLVEACRVLNADILGLQEVDVGVPRSDKVHLAEKVADVLDMDCVFAKARTFKRRGKVGNALLVRGTINRDNVKKHKMNGDWQRVKLLNYRLPLVPEPRVLLDATAIIGGHEMAIGVTHTGGNHQIKKRQIRESAANVADRPQPYKILLGDLNIHLAAVQECVEPYGLEALKGPNTYPADDPQYQIDHIALGGLRMVGFEVFPRLPVSDHSPFVAEIERVQPAGF